MTPFVIVSKFGAQAAGGRCELFHELPSENLDSLVIHNILNYLDFIFFQKKFKEHRPKEDFAKVEILRSV